MKKRFLQNLSHYKLLTCNMGNLIPISWYPVLPGDTVQHRTSLLIRVSPLLKPLMHPVRVRVHHFFIPNRLVWNNDGGAETDFEAFITGGSDGTKTPTHPYKALASVAESGLYDYLGVPAYNYAAGAGALNVNVLPQRAYQLTWDNFYRDQDLGTSPTIDKSDGADTTTSTTLQKVSWEKDYFTAARPWEQKGNTVTVPFTGDADVIYDGAGYPAYTDGTNSEYLTGDGTNIPKWTGTSLSGNTYLDPTQLIADLETNAGIDLSELRLAFGLQKYQEARAKYGSRMVEYLRSAFGVRSSDARLQNPEFLAGSRSTIQFTEVLSTDGANTGDMKGHGISALRGKRFRRFFEEHGIVMTFLSVVPKAIYESAMAKEWFKTVKEDYFQKELQFIGEQQIKNKEVHSDHATPDGVFGYQSRYDDYRYIPSTIAGEFRSTNDDWHLARIFGSDPALNNTFTDCTPATRIYASSSTDQLFIMASHNVKARRQLIPVAYNKIVG